MPRKKTLSIVVGLKDQIKSPEIKYEKPNCDANGGFAGEPELKIKEKIELNLFLWSIGFKNQFQFKYFLYCLLNSSSIKIKIKYEIHSYKNINLLMK